MGSVGDAYDNAMCESFFATLECELLDRSRFPTPAYARREVFGFIEGFFNTRRIHSALRQHFADEFRETQPCGLKRRCSFRGDRSAPDFSWTFASSAMYVAYLREMTREKRNHIRHHQPQKPTVREQRGSSKEAASDKRVFGLGWLGWRRRGLCGRGGRVVGHVVVDDGLGGLSRRRRDVATIGYIHRTRWEKILAP